jgi:hypothetical protein
MKTATKNLAQFVGHGAKAGRPDHIWPVFTFFTNILTTST